MLLLFDVPPFTRHHPAAAGLLPYYWHGIWDAAAPDMGYGMLLPLACCPWPAIILLAWDVDNALFLHLYRHLYAFLCAAGLFTRDSPMVERKKPGRKKARKSYQWVKR